jgi:hypothetical protein
LDSLIKGSSLVEGTPHESYATRPNFDCAYYLRPANARWLCGGISAIFNRSHQQLNPPNQWHNDRLCEWPCSR